MTSKLKPCPLTIALFNAADEIDGCGGGNEAEIMRVAANRIMKQRQEIETLNTHAVPDVSELVRLCPEVTSAGHPYMRSDKEGDYVLHSQAAEIIAAKDGRITAQVEEIARLNSDIEAMEKRAEAAEAKLAQYEAQEPVAWMHPDAGWTDVCKVKVSNHCKKGIKPTPLYTSPAPCPDLKAENDRLREALTVASMSAGFQYMASETRALISAALNVEASNDQ